MDGRQAGSPGQPILLLQAESEHIMGQAKKRGTFEERKAESINNKKQAWIDDAPKRQAIQAARSRSGKSRAHLMIALSAAMRRNFVK